MKILWIIPLIILTTGVFWDLRERRVPNSWILGTLFVSIVGIAIFEGSAAWGDVFLSMGLAGLLLSPLFAFRVLGGGDFKIFVVAAMWIPSSFVFHSFLYSVVWGAVLGLTYALLQGRLRQVMTNTLNTALHKTSIAEEQITKIPFTVALLLGVATSFLSGGG